MKNKKLGIFAIIAGVILIIIAVWLSNLGLKSSIYQYSSNTRDVLRIFPFLLGVVGGFAVFIGLICIVMNFINDSKPSEVKYGKVIEKTKSGIYDMITVEFNDGTRKKLLASKIILSVGDAGMIEMKGQFVMSFKKQ